MSILHDYGLWKEDIFDWIFRMVVVKILRVDYGAHGEQALFALRCLRQLNGVSIHPTLCVEWPRVPSMSIKAFVWGLADEYLYGLPVTAYRISSWFVYGLSGVILDVPWVHVDCVYAVCKHWACMETVRQMDLKSKVCAQWFVGMCNTHQSHSHNGSAANLRRNCIARILLKHVSKSQVRGWTFWKKVSCRACYSEFQGTSALVLRKCVWCVGVGPHLGYCSIC